MGFRPQHLQEILTTKHPVAWFEVLSDNLLTSNGKLLSGSSLALSCVEELRDRYPLTLHGVGLSLGSVDRLDRSYLRQLKALIQRLKPAWVSEHLAWTAVHGQHFHDLLPLPYTEKTLRHVCRRIAEAQDFLETQLVVENVSSYLAFECSCMPEAEFVSRVAQQSGCALLLDISNIIVTSYNNDLDPQAYLATIPVKHVRQFHLGGFERRANYLLDSHASPIAPASWDLYAAACRRFGPLATTIEWDNELPAFTTVCGEVRKAARIALRSRTEKAA
jgi:uncharacterized protein (UPF0276 family)